MGAGTDRGEEMRTQGWIHLVGGEKKGKKVIPIASSSGKVITLFFFHFPTEFCVTYVFMLQ